MFTRKEYLDGKCSHYDYYNQFVTPEILMLVKNNFGIELLKKSFKDDEHFNKIPIKSWDVLANKFKCNHAFNQVGDYATEAGKVCILKAAAKQLVNTIQ